MASSTFALSFALLLCVSLASAQNFLDLSDSDILGLKLKTSLTEVKRQELLNSSQYVFDFSEFYAQVNASGVVSGQGGKNVQALTTNFPALIGHGMSMTVGFIEPCGINLPHTHPRATELNFIMAGSFRVGFFQENNAHFVGNTLTAGQMTVFPQGAIHFEQNMGCTPAMFVAAFNSEDPGVQTTSSTYFGLPADIAGVGIGLSAAEVQALTVNLAKNPALGVQQCRIQCGIESANSSSSNSTSPPTNSTSPPSTNSSSSNSSSHLACHANITLSGPVASWNDSTSHNEQFTLIAVNTGEKSAQSTRITLDFPAGSVIAQWNMEHQFSTVWQVTLFGLASGQNISDAGFIWSVPLAEFSQVSSESIELNYLHTWC